MNEIRSYVLDEMDRPVEGFEGVVTWRTLVDAAIGPSAGLSVGVAEVPRGAPVESSLHRHAHHETYFVLSGDGVVHLDGEELPVGPGSSVFIAGGTRHAAECRGDGVLRILYAFAADSLDDVDYDYGP